MVTLSAVLGLLLIVSAHTIVAAIGTRLLRVRLGTRWGAAFYIVLLIPLVLLLSTLILSGVFQIGPNIGNPATAIFITVFVPLAIGTTIDYIWMPAPDEVVLPDSLR